MSPRGYRSTLHGRTPAGFAPCGRGRDQHHGHHGAAAHGRRDGHQERHHGHLEAAELTACPRIRRLGAGTRPGASERNRRNPTQPESAVDALEGHQRADSSETSSPVSWEALQSASYRMVPFGRTLGPKVTRISQSAPRGPLAHPGASYATVIGRWRPRSPPARRAEPVRADGQGVGPGADASDCVTRQTGAADRDVEQLGSEASTPARAAVVSAGPGDQGRGQPGEKVASGHAEAPGSTQGGGAVPGLRAPWKRLWGRGTARQKRCLRQHVRWPIGPGAEV